MHKTIAEKQEEIEKLKKESEDYDQPKLKSGSSGYWLWIPKNHFTNYNISQRSLSRLKPAQSQTEIE